MPFAFVSNIDGVGAWPPVYESHVEMDGAWALNEAWLRLQLGDIDVALVIGSGKSSPGRPREVFSLQTDPYVMAPLGLDPLSLAGLQARTLLDAGLATEARLRRGRVPQSRRDALDNPNAQVAATLPSTSCWPSPTCRRRSGATTCPPISDGAAALVLAAGDRARELTDHPVWIRGIDHRIESHHPGLRDLTTSPSTELAAAGAGVGDGPVDVAELMVNYSLEEIVLRRALGLNGSTRGQPVGRPAGRRTRSHGHRAHPGHRGGRPHRGRRGAAGVWPTRRAARACNRTWCASWRARAHEGRRVMGRPCAVVGIGQTKYRRQASTSRSRAWCARPRSGARGRRA